MRVGNHKAFCLLCSVLTAYCSSRKTTFRVSGGPGKAENCGSKLTFAKSRENVGGIPEASAPGRNTFREEVSCSSQFERDISPPHWAGVAGVCGGRDVRRRQDTKATHIVTTAHTDTPPPYTHIAND